MADNTIDTLSINITSSSQGATNAINNLCRNLEKLSGALGNFDREEGRTGQALNHLEAGFEQLNRSISKIDSSNLNRVAKSLNMIANATDRLKSSFENVGLSKAEKEAQALQNAINKATQSIVEMSGTSKSVSGQMSKLFSTYLGDIKWENGAFKELGDKGWNAFDQMIKTMMQNGAKSSHDVIDRSIQDIVNYINSNMSKVKLPFKLSDIDSGNQYNMNPKQLLASVFGVGNWSTSGKGDMNLAEFIEQFNSATGQNISVDETAQAFEQLATVVLDAKQKMREFNDGVMEVDVDIDQMYQEFINAAVGVERFRSALQTGMVDLKGDNPYSMLVESLRGLEELSVPNLEGLGMLASNIGKLANKKASEGIARLPSLVQSLQSLSAIGAVTIPDLTGIAELCANIGKLSNKKASQGVQNLPVLVQGLTQLQALSGMTFPDGTQIAELAQAFSILGRETSGRAVQNIPALATAFRQLMQTLSSTPKVSQSVIELAKAMAMLSANGSKVGSATKGISSAFDGIGRSSQSIVGRIVSFAKNLLVSGRNAEYAGSKYNTLASKLGLLYAKYWMVLRVVNMFSRIITPASNLIEVQNVVDTTFDNMAKKVEDFAKSSIKNFGLSELSAKQYASQFQAMGTAMGITTQQVQKAQQFLNTKRTMEGTVAGYNKLSNSMADMSINLTKLAADIASFYDIEQSTVAKALQSGVMAGQTRPLILAA